MTKLKQLYVVIGVLTAGIIFLAIFRSPLWYSFKKEKQGKILARVGDEVLTLEDFYILIPNQYLRGLTAFEKEELVKQWIKTSLFYQAALEEGIDKEEEMRTRLEQVKREVLANEFLARHLPTEIYVEDSTAKNYFEKHKNEFAYECKAAQIVVPTEGEAQAVLDRLKRGESFAKLARELSIDPSSKNGGVIGYIRRGDMPNMPEFEEALFSLKNVGDISDIVRSVYGYHIIKLLDKRMLKRKVQYKDVKDGIKEILLTKQRSATLEEIFTKLQSEKNIDVYYELLK
ncbi:MAG TPA: hypothetical protein EYP60_05745 [bacterium (Candidatus Stahlbacteria)]|nr:hypothetical protein [Candidatus Stahlbacteria bacterium]